jgi:hypothetical protein
MAILANNRLDLHPQGMLFLQQLLNAFWICIRGFERLGQEIIDASKGNLSSNPGLPGQDFLHSEDAFGKFV